MGVTVPSTFARAEVGFLVRVAALLALVLVVLARPAKDTKLVFGQDGLFKIAQFADRKPPVPRRRCSRSENSHSLSLHSSSMSSVHFGEAEGTLWGPQQDVV